MKQNLTVFTLTVVILINITGCSVVRFAETRMGEGIKPANKTRMDLDFQFGFNPTDQSLRVTLARQPYAVYKPKITLTDLGVGLASLGLLGKVLYDNWDHDYTFTFVDDTFDWYGSEPWEKAVMIGVPADILLYWAFAYPFDWKAMRMPRQPLTDHRYRIELPDHGSIGRDYRTTTGIEHIEVREFLSELGNVSFLRDIETLKFRAATEIGGKQHKRDYAISPVPLPLTPPPPPPPRQVEIEALWVENRLSAGKRAILKITVSNARQTALTEFTATTSSENLRFHDWKLEFGDIASETSKTRALGFSTDEVSPQAVPVHLRFEAANDFTHPEIEKILHIIQ